MNDFVAGVLRLIVRLVVLAMGVVVFLSLLAAVLVLALAWGARAGWARLTGRPVTPWVMRMDPRRGFGAAFRTSQRWSATAQAPRDAAGPTADAAASRRHGILPGAAEVTDVQAREVR